MQLVFKEFSSNVIIYIDDILIVSENLEQHLDIVGKVLATLSRHGLKIKLPKCHFFQRQVDFLGHCIGRSGITKSKEYVKEVENFPRPETVTQLRRFLGMVNFQRMFMENCSVIAKPLSDLTGGPKRRKLKWTPEMETAFNELKKLIARDVELAFPN